MEELRYIICPECQNRIYYDIEGMLLGREYICEKCNSRFSLAQESKQTVANAMESYKKLKEKSSK